MGGYVALYLASANENLLDKIANLGTKFDWNPETALKESKMLNVEQIEIKVPKFAEVLERGMAKVAGTICLPEQQK
jgi:hypothetical protein